MAGEIWVLADEWRGQLSESTFEALALGQEMAAGLGAGLRMVTPDPQAAPLEQALRTERPQAVLIPLTNATLGLGSILAARLQWPSVNFCRDVRVDGGRLEASCIIYGGKIESKVALGTGPAVLGVWPGARPPDKGREVCALQVACAWPEDKRVRLKRYIEPEGGDFNIGEQEVLVAVGRGIQNKENIAVAEELAGLLGGKVCGSRPVIDQGWLPLSRQVGKSGHSVKPRLYIALGISGAPEHVEGMRGATLIVAVNSDAQAPIFNVAHYGVVGDAVEFAEALSRAARTRKGTAADA